MEEENVRHIVRVYVGALSQEYEALSVEASKHTTAEEIVSCIVQKLGFRNSNDYELAEVIENSTGQECKERRIGAYESPVALKLLWPKASEAADSILFSSTSPSTTISDADSNASYVTISPDQYRFCLREKLTDSLWSESFVMDPQIIRDYFYRFLYQPKDKEYPDLCQLPDLNEQTLLDNLKSRFTAGHIYSYVGSILIAVNPFKFHPIYNPKYVKLYQNRRREELPPHIFAIADSAYHTMLKEKRNQCIVISGESGSGKTESTNFLLHHLTALSQKGTHGSGVEQTILSAGPVLEAFGNAKTAHNNNSSRFGKFIQVSYRENGMVHGAIVQKYLLEKSRICCQAKNERNYHVFYYLLAGASDSEKEALNLLPPHNYHYLNQSGCYTLEGVDESYEFSRLKQSMEMVGFGAHKQRKLFCVLSAVLLLGNIEFLPKKSSYHHDESVLVKNPEVVRQISSLLRVTEETLLAALTSKRARVSGEMLVINYRMPEAIAARDAMAKCLYGALFDWIVLQVNHALLSKKDLSGSEHLGKSIGVLDIFGFEDFDHCNSFEQFCINYANEHLQHYFNQHVFKYEQEEYKKEGIRWTNIGFMDNTPCLKMIEAKPNGLICIADDQCNFPGATNETLLQKFNSVHKEHKFYRVPQRREAAFIVRHYAGEVKYQVMEFREKNMDLMRHDIVSVLKNSSLAFVRELVGIDPVAVFRWAILRAFFRAYFAFSEAGHRRRAAKTKSTLSRAFSSPGRRRSSGNDHLVSDADILDDSRLSYSHLPLSRTDYEGLKYKPIRRAQHRPHSYYTQRPYPSLNLTVAYEPALSSPPSMTPIVNGNGDSFNGHSHCVNCCTRNSHCSPHSATSCCYPGQHDYNDYSPHAFYVKNRSFRSQPLVTRGMKNLQSVKTLASQTAAMGVANKSYNPRKQPISVLQQFQQSLHSLMVTLNQANPFFIRCIKSNFEKIPNKFNDDLVQRQLRYTGMLETVRIRQAGYNVRLTFDEFVQIYRILLPKGLESTRADVEDFLSSLSLNRINYQLGETKVFLRESEKIKLDFILHQQIMASIVRIQRWYRTVLERRNFLHVQEMVIKIQSYIRMILAQRSVTNMRMRTLAATYIQKVWRGYRVRKWYTTLKDTCIQFQARVRGNMVRQRYQQVLEQHRRLSKQRDKLQTVIRVKGDGDSHSGQSTDEAFLSKGSSQEELDENKLSIPADLGESDESSGVHEDSETESLQSEPSVRQPEAVHPVQAMQPLPSLTDSMPALTLALTSTPFTLQHQTSLSGSGRSPSPNKRERSPSLSKDNPSQPQFALVKERPEKKKLSLKSRREKATAKFGEEEFIQCMKELEIADMSAKFEEEQSTGNSNSSKNPFHRAKKHIKTLIIGNNVKTKLEKHEAVLLDSESETENADTLTLNSNSNSNSTPSVSAVPLDAVDSPTPKIKICKKQPRLSLESSPGPPSNASSSLNLRQTRSLQSVPVPEIDVDQDTDLSSTIEDLRRGEYHHQRYHRKIVRDDNSGGGRSRLDRREERRRIIAEREAMRTNSGSISFDHDSGVASVSERRDSEEWIGLGGDLRRGSRDSNQSIRSPSQSSQDSLFEMRSISQQLNQKGAFAMKNGSSASSVGFTNVSNSSTIALPKSGVSTSQSALVELSPSRSSKYSADNNNKHTGGGPKTNRTSSTVEIGTGREVRRTRSVSETRKTTNGRNFSAETSTSPFVSSEFATGMSTEEVFTDRPRKSGFHNLDKITKFHRGDFCTACRKNMHVLFAPGYKCYTCKLYFHSKCVQNGIVYDCLCENQISNYENSREGVIGDCATKSSTVGRRKARKQTKTQTDMNKPGKFSLTGTSEFTDRTDQIISGVRELQLMQEFISKKIYQVRNKEGEKENAVDRVFTQALREFKESLVSTFSVASKHGGTMPLNIKYKDLIANFANIMETVCKHEGTGNDFPTTMGVNAFRGFLNEFMNSHRVEEKPKVTKTRKERRKDKGSKRQKVEETINHLGHCFVSMVINIPTACEMCSSFIMWPIERGVVCQKCKLACHKKCHLKILIECNEVQGRNNSTSGSDCGIFGASIASLVPENGTVPVVVDQLITAIEFYGLRMEGLYRKSGVSSRVRELKVDIEEGVKEIDYELYPVHVLTSVLKSFFREMPEPLLTFELYDEYLRAADLSQQEDRIHTIFSILKKLPKPNYDLMERLVFHLVRVALYEEKNRMNANSLAIVFAPCILKTNKTRQVQESLSDIGRQTMCIETIILEQLKKVKETLSNIESVDSAAHSFSVRLNSIRSSKMRSPPDRKKVSSRSSGSSGDCSAENKSINESSTPESMSAEEEEEYLTRHIQHLQDEKALLTSVLPSLSRTPSDEDMLSTDPEVDSPGGSVDDLHRASPSPRTTRAQSLQYSKSDSLVVEHFQSRLSPTLRTPASAKTNLLQSVAKNRGPIRKPPSRFVRNLSAVDFGEHEGEEDDSYQMGNEHEDASVISVDDNNDEEAIMV